MVVSYHQFHQVPHDYHFHLCFFLCLINHKIYTQTPKPTRRMLISYNEHTKIKFGPRFMPHSSLPWCQLKTIPINPQAWPSSEKVQTLFSRCKYYSKRAPYHSCDIPSIINLNTKINREMNVGIQIETTA